MVDLFEKIQNLHVTALAGGVGGAKLAYGLAQVLPFENLTIIVNTGDDFDHYGLRICPDLDTVCYTLAGLSNKKTGWGLEGDTSSVLSALQKIDAPTWFQLGDRDMATHLERTRRLVDGQSLTQITNVFLRIWGVHNKILPMTDDKVMTMIKTNQDKWLPFQEYFVHQACDPEVRDYRFAGIEKAQPAPGVINSIETSDLVIICPSNPWVSIDPILNIKGIRKALHKKTVVAVSPIIAGKALKGPAAKMCRELGLDVNVVSVMHHYQEFLAGFIIDLQDDPYVEIINQCNIIPFVTNTIMLDDHDKINLAFQVLSFGKNILNGEVK